jgi:hypothetical protein
LFGRYGFGVGNIPSGGLFISFVPGFVGTIGSIVLSRIDSIAATIAFLGTTTI